MPQGSKVTGSFIIIFEEINVYIQLIEKNLQNGDYVASLAETFSNYLTATKLAIGDTLTNKTRINTKLSSNENFKFQPDYPKN